MLHDVSTDAMLALVIGTVFPVTDSPSIELRFIADGATAVLELLPVMVTPCGRFAVVVVDPVAIFSPTPFITLLVKFRLLSGAFGTTEKMFSAYEPTVLLSNVTFWAPQLPVVAFGSTSNVS